MAMTAWGLVNRTRLGCSIGAQRALPVLRRSPGPCARLYPSCERQTTLLLRAALDNAAWRLPSSLQTRRSARCTTALESRA